jgi:hypothetical protein
VLSIATWSASIPCHSLSLWCCLMIVGHVATGGEPPARGCDGRRQTACPSKCHVPDFRPSPESAAVGVPDVGFLFLGKGSWSSAPMLPRAEPGNVRVLGRIGGGSFGSVFKVRFRDTGTTAALKQVSLVGLSPSEQVRGHWSLTCAVRLDVHVAVCSVLPVLSPSCRNPQLTTYLNTLFCALGCWGEGSPVMPDLEQAGRGGAVQKPSQTPSFSHLSHDLTTLPCVP